MKPDERILLLTLASLQRERNAAKQEALATGKPTRTGNEMYDAMASISHHFAAVSSLPRGEFADATAQRLGINVKRAMYILDKWCGKRWWDYGVSLRSGWLTELGFAKAEEEAQ